MHNLRNIFNKLIRESGWIAAAGLILIQTFWRPKAYIRRWFEVTGNKRRLKGSAIARTAGHGPWAGSKGSFWWAPIAPMVVWRKPPRTSRIPPIPILRATLIYRVRPIRTISPYKPRSGPGILRPERGPEFINPLTTFRFPIPIRSYTPAPDIGFRNMFTFTEQSGTQALYVSGCSAGSIYPGVPGARLLRSTDGVNFVPVAQDLGRCWAI